MRVIEKLSWISDGYSAVFMGFLQEICSWIEGDGFEMSTTGAAVTICMASNCQVLGQWAVSDDFL